MISIKRVSFVQTFLRLAFRLHRTFYRYGVNAHLDSYNNNNDHIKDKPRYQNSLDHHEPVKELGENKRTIDSILFDSVHNQTYPICRSYKPTSFGSVGTVCSLIIPCRSFFQPAPL
ncbi:unnamed protein product [Rotaria magnacalcarata]|uniref:Uncharacterized protein n=1 Tax=Rotaria magnacalcarata TaxID=392030 RepID=A0A816EIL6_9BILA|nr:unnamed protein product [Rotaria magnacalcarata]